MQWSLNGDMEFSVENVVYHSSIDKDKIEEYFDLKVRDYAKNRLVDTRYFPLDPHFNKDTVNLDGIILKHLLRIYWSCIVNFFNVEEINTHFGLEYFEQTKLTPESLEKSVRFHSKKLINKDTANIVEDNIKYLFKDSRMVELDIENAAQNDQFKNLNWINNKMLFKPQNMILNTEDYDYMDAFAPYVYKADIKNRTFNNSPTWDNKFHFYLDEYHKFMLYSYLYTVGGRNFKKFIKPLLQDYFPDQSIQNIYDAARQYICRNKDDVKSFTDIEKLCFEFEFKDLIAEYGIVWDKDEQLKAKESLAINKVIEEEIEEEVEEVEDETEEEGEEEDEEGEDEEGETLKVDNPLLSSKNCDISVKEEDENKLTKEDNILYNNASFTPMSQNALPDSIEPTDLTLEQKIKAIPEGPDFWEQFEKLIDSLPPVPQIEKTPEELERERLEQEANDRFYEELRRM